MEPTSVGAGRTLGAEGNVLDPGRLLPEDDLLRSALTHLPFFSFHTDEELRIRSAFSHHQAILTGEWIGRRVDETGEPPDLSALLPLLQDARATGLPCHQKIAVPHLAETFHFEVWIEPSSDEREPLHRLAVTALDVTDRVQAEAALAQSEERSRVVLQAINDATWDWDLERDRIDWNQATVDLFGWPEAAAGTSIGWWEDRVHPEDREGVVRSLRDVIGSRQDHWSQEYRFLRQDGTYAYVLDRGYLLRTADGSPSRMIGALIDLTPIRLAEKALREREEELSRAQAVGRIGSWRLDVRSGLLHWSDETYRIFGIPTGIPMTYERFLEAVHPEDRHLVDAHWQAALSGDSYDTEHRILVAGETRWVNERAFLDLDETGAIIRGFGTVQDVTDRKRIELRLRESEERYRTMGETLPYGVWMCNAQGGAEYVSQSFLDLLEMTADEMKEFGWTNRLVPEDVEPMLKKWRHCIESGEDWDSEHRVLGPDGRYHYVLTRGKPVRNGSSDIVSWVGINLDIDERKRMEEELRQLNATLEQRVADRTKTLDERNRELQQFAFIASHDLQEPLRKVQTFTDLMKQDFGPELSTGAVAYLDRIHQAAARMSELIRDMSAFSRINTHEEPLRRVRIEDAVRAVLRDLDALLESTGGRIEMEAMVEVEVNPHHLHQLINHLLLNAIKFQSPGTRPLIRIVASREPGVGASEMCRIVVSDNGIGFDPKHADRIFEPFQRLHGRDQYPGTGMGLAICRRIIERHGGTIRAQSTPGKGSRFIVELPIQPRGGGGIPSVA